VTAKRLSVVATRCPGCGTIRVTFAGRLLKTLSLNANRLHAKQIIPLARFSSLRTGVVRIEVASSGRPVRIEGLGASAA
jgi:hypothetical protein